MSSTRARLLVATPELLDPNFFRTVVLMLEHTDEGAMGLVLNRTYDAVAEEVVPYWADRLKPPGTLHCGGPVSEESVVGLGRVPLDGVDGVARHTDVLERAVVQLPKVAARAVTAMGGWKGWLISS